MSLLGAVKGLCSTVIGKCYALGARFLEPGEAGYEVVATENVEDSNTLMELYCALHSGFSVACTFWGKTGRCTPKKKSSLKTGRR